MARAGRDAKAVVPIDPCGALLPINRLLAAAARRRRAAVVGALPAHLADADDLERVRSARFAQGLANGQHDEVTRADLTARDEALLGAEQHGVTVRALLEE